MTVIAHSIDHIALGLRQHLGSNFRAGTSQQWLGQFQRQVRHLRFTIEIQHQIIGQRGRHRGTCLEKFLHRHVRIRIATKSAIGLPGDSKVHCAGGIPHKFMARTGQGKSL